MKRPWVEEIRNSFVGELREMPVKELLHEDNDYVLAEGETLLYEDQWRRSVLRDGKSLYIPKEFVLQLAQRYAVNVKTEGKLNALSAVWDRCKADTAENEDSDDDVYGFRGAWATLLRCIEVWEHFALGGCLGLNYGANGVGNPVENLYITVDTTRKKTHSHRAQNLRRRMLRNCLPIDHAHIAKLNAELPPVYEKFGFTWHLSGRNALTGQAVIRRFMYVADKDDDDGDDEEEDRPKNRLPLGRLIRSQTRLVKKTGLREVHNAKPEYAAFVTLYVAAFNAVVKYIKSNRGIANREEGRKRKNLAFCIDISFRHEGVKYLASSVANISNAKICHGERIMIDQRDHCPVNPHWKKVFYSQTTLKPKTPKETEG